MIELLDEDAPEPIRNFVRNNHDVEFTQYHRRGQMGEVYFGRRLKLNDDVAYKFYWAKPDYDSSEEAVILRHISHKNILRLYELKFLPPSFAYFVTPKLSCDLQQQIEVGRLSSRRALEITADILLGVTELHSKHQLVHRDLKPPNVLLDVKLSVIADLGAVKKISEEKDFVNASKATCFYLPPESIEENKYYFQSDLYQVGLILFQSLGGFFPINTPYDWLTSKQRRELSLVRDGTQQQQEFDRMIGKQILKGTLADLHTLPQYLDGGFKRVLAKALQIDHSRRFKNSSEFLQAVHGLIRTYPDYSQQGDTLLIIHGTHSEYRANKDAQGRWSVEKRIDGKQWRRNNNHDGRLTSILRICKNK
ncbi:MAG: protein kinase [Chitinophagales bacterium]|nr:protein kinase [Chitinophagales bacterium]